MILATLLRRDGLRTLMGRDSLSPAILATGATGPTKPAGTVAPVAEIASIRLHRDKFENLPPPSKADPDFIESWTKALARLDATKSPAGVPPRRWQQFVNDAFSFARAGWADNATALGWQVHDLVGCDRIKPFERIDRAGLLWLLNGATLVVLTETTAVIETTSGARQTYRRRKHSHDAVILAWELDVRWGL